jgi:hypothetical protein
MSAIVVSTLKQPSVHEESIGRRVHRFRSITRPQVSVNQHAPSLLETRERFIKEKPTREYLSEEFGIDSFSVGILMMYFDLVVMLNISFIPMIEFPYSTGDPLLIMPSPMSWQLSFLVCCPVAGEPSEH